MSQSDDSNADEPTSTDVDDRPAAETAGDEHAPEEPPLPADLDVVPPVEDLLPKADPLGVVPGLDDDKPLPGQTDGDDTPG